MKIKRTDRVIIVGTCCPTKTKHQQDDIQSIEGISRCLVVGCHGNSNCYTKIYLEEDE